MEATFVAVVAFCTTPVHAFDGQLTLKLETFKGFGPTLNLTISLKPSSFEGEVAEHASTKIV